MTEAVSKDRTRNYLRQLKGAFVFRAVAMVASFIAIPLMIRYLGQEQFGVWSTLLTVMSWIIFFDLGIGNGLRNKVAESLAKDKRTEARSYIASGYTLVGLIAMTLWIIVTVGSYFIPWQSVFNTNAISPQDLGKTVRIMAFFILLNFWLGLIGPILGGVQRTSLVALGQLVSNLLVLALVFYLARTTEALISNLAFVYGLSIVTGNLLLSLWLYKKRPELRPLFYIDKHHISPLLSVGLQFFIIQLAVLVIFTTDKILITQLFGPQYVTEYEVIFKLFSVISFFHGMISAPLWSAYTDAYHREDFGWIKKMLRKQLLIYIGLVMVTGLIIVFSKKIINIWIGGEVNISSELIFLMGLFILVSVWNNIYAMVVNGIGKIKPQLYTAIVAMFTNIPLSIIFVKYTEFGLSGIVMGTVCSLLFASLVLPIQVHRLLR